MRVGNQVFVSGTAPVDEQGNTFAPNDAYAQTQRCFEIIGKALHQLGASLEDVVRTRLYVTDVSRWEEFAKAHHQIFASHPPVNTMVEIKSLMSPDMLIEVEVDAICESD
jgi:isochorismate pyruvate lyase